MLGSPLQRMLYPPGVTREGGTATAHRKCRSVPKLPLESSCPAALQSAQASRAIAGQRSYLLASRVVYWPAELFICQQSYLFASILHSPAWQKELGEGWGELRAQDPLGMGQAPQAGTRTPRMEQEQHRGFLSLTGAPSLPCSLLPAQLASPASPPWLHGNADGQLVSSLGFVWFQLFQPPSIQLLPTLLA